MKLDTQGRRDYFRPSEKALQEDFLPDLFLGAEAHMPDRSIMVFSAKHSGLVILDMTLNAQGNLTASCMVTRHIVALLCIVLSSSQGTMQNS